MGRSTKFLFIQNYIVYIIALVTSIYFIIRIYQYIFKNKSILTNKYAKSGLAKELWKKYKKQQNIIALCCMIVWILSVAYLTPSNIKGAHYLINKKPEVIICKIDYVVDGSLLGSNYAGCRNEKGNITFKYIGPQLKEDTIVDVKYYRDIEIGEIIKIYR